MKPVLIACSMLEDEIRYIMRESRLNYPVVWIERGLHEFPEKLHRRLQEEVALAEGNYDTILLGYCRCGNAWKGLTSPRATLAAMDCDDCVRMLLGNGRCDFRSLYFTGGWLRSEGFIGREYQAARKKYGVCRAERIYRRLLNGYTHLRMIDTGAYDLPQYLEEAAGTAKRLNLQFDVQQGDLSLLRAFLTFRWDDRIWVAPPVAQPVKKSERLCEG